MIAARARPHCAAGGFLCEISPFSTSRASGTGVLADGTGLPLNHLWELTGRIQAVLGILQAVQKYRLYRSGKRAGNGVKN
jgi:hypothetical protein